MSLPSNEGSRRRRKKIKTDKRRYRWISDKNEFRCFVWMSVVLFGLVRNNEIDHRSNAWCCSSGVMAFTVTQYNSFGRRISSNLGSSVLDLQELERMGEEASKLWDSSVTPFMNIADAEALQERLDQRSDVGYFRAASPQPNPLRYRLVMTHPDNVPILEASSVLDNSQFSSLLRVDRTSSDSNNAAFPSWPHVLTKIGIDLQDVGDAWTCPSSPNSAYIVVNPKIVKRCLRILPKELYKVKGGGAGLTISIVDEEHYYDIDFPDPTHPDQSILPMELSKYDQRAQKYKDHPNYR